MKSIILAGAPRSGKTTLAKRLQQELNFSLQSGDGLVCAFGGIFPSLNISPQNDMNETAKNIQWFLRAYFEQLARYQNIPFIIDIVQLSPEFVVEQKFHELYEVVFFGYPNADPNEKLASIRKFKADHFDWAEERKDEEIMPLIQEYIDYSKKLQDSCARLGLNFIDTSHDFAAKLDTVYNKIIGAK